MAERLDLRSRCRTFTLWEPAASKLPWRNLDEWGRLLAFFLTESASWAEPAPNRRFQQVWRQTRNRNERFFNFFAKLRNRIEKANCIRVLWIVKQIFRSAAFD
jgi:hypothetical protein